ncbi:hypothetical protein CBS101457_004661 [Exobasidium rhododendri]|nr:hypothetical protein CBS101457_004661 [Exobasidium rhododendri]
MAGVGIGDGPSFGMGMYQDRTPPTETAEKVTQKRAPLAAPNLLVTSSVPTIALHTDSGNEEIFHKEKDEPPAERASVLTSRLAMQLKNAEASASKAPRAPSPRKPSRSNDEEARMAVCKVCLDFDYRSEAGSTELDGTGSNGRRKRSGTVTLKSERRNKSTSDHTIKESEESYTDPKVSWKANEFTGPPLLLNPLSSDIDLQSREGNPTQLQLIGGTFVIETGNNDEEEENDLRNVLDAGLYAASAMMLETALLRNFLVVSTAVVSDFTCEGKEESEGAAAQDTSPIDNGPPLPRPNPEMKEGPPEKQTRWSTGIWSMMQYGSSDLSSAARKQHHSSIPSRSSNSDTKPTKKAERAAVGYSGKLGKIITSFTGNVSKRASKTDSAKPGSVDLAQGDTEDAQQSNCQNESSDKKENKEAHTYTPPLSISPYYPEHDATKKDDQEEESYLERLLSRQSLSLTVLEGLDVSLPLVNQQRQASEASTDSKRLPSSHARETSVDAESKGTASTLSVARSVASTSTESIRSSSGASQARPPTQLSSKASLASTTVDHDMSWTESNRRDVHFYQKTGDCRDVSLGQAIEEMAAKAIVLDKESKPVKEKEKEKGQTKKKDAGKGLDEEVLLESKYRVAQYLHGQSRVSVLALVAQGTSTPSSSTPSTAKGEDHGEIDLVAKSALLLAEQAQQQQQASQSSRGDDASVDGVPQEDNGTGREEICLWSANVQTGEETSVTAMSEETYLSSFGSFVEALVHHPMFDKDRYETVRLFKVGGITLKFQIQRIVVYDLLVEGPVVIVTPGEKVQEAEMADEKSALFETTRLEIQSFYALLKGQISTLEHLFVARELDEAGKTIGPPVASSRVASSVLSSGSDVAPNYQMGGPSSSSSGPFKLLSRVKESLRKSEFELYDALKCTKVSSLNDVRKQFRDRAKSAKNRLIAWENKHLSEDELKRLKPVNFSEPEYFGKGKHAFPGSRYLLREEEPLSIIAYTLSSRDFEEEMYRKDQKIADVLNWRTSVYGPSRSSQFTASNASTKTSDSSTTKDSAAASVVDAASAATSVLDPDHDEDFHIPEPLCVNMKRKRRVKDAGILSLTLKRVNSNISSSLSGRPGESGSEREGEDVDLHTSDSQSTALADDCDFDEDDVITPTASRMVAPCKFNTISTTNETFRAQIAHVAPRGSGSGSLGSMFAGASTAPATPSEEKDLASLLSSSSSNSGTEGGSKTTPTLETNERFQRRVASQPVESSDVSSTPKVPVSPHIKQSIECGDMKISCISWFAEDFLKLRQKWNINADFIESMSRCKHLNMMGGKSKSGFYLTLDGKWIAKQLLNVWSVDEKEAFLEFAPAYLRYMMNSAVNDCPTLLVKIAGVYTLKIKNVKTGEVKLKMSVQVLENVFAGDQGESIRFDIKGIKDRRITVKKKDASTEEEERAPVWWDGEWLDCFQARAFVPERDKIIFRKALHNDLAFLTASNVMDYSLLIGAHEQEEKEKEEEKGGKEGKEGKEGKRRTPGHANRTTANFRVRIVDFLGAWTLVKQIESSGKKAIKSQTPTIIPPNDYALRFGQAVETYFIPCPGISSPIIGNVV